MLEVPVGTRFAYLHYLGKHTHYGDAVLVGPKLQDTKVTVDAALFSGGYVTFYPVVAAVTQELVSIVGYLPPMPLPKRFRRPGAIVGRQVKTWIVDSDTGDAIKSQLSEDDLRLPIASIWNHEYLIQRIAEGWDPLQEGRAVSKDGEVTAELAAVSHVDAPHSILHYIYLPSRETAAAVGKELRDRGFTTEERLGADGTNWLVLARHFAVPSEAAMSSIRRSMEALVAKVGGEYDGWEVNVQHHKPAAH